MTKKEQIAQSALDLFAHNGIEATSTRSIAASANVSEALIFRHYLNKKGLIEHLNDILLNEIEQLIKAWSELEAKERIKTLMELPFTIPSNMQKYWNFYYKVSWSAYTPKVDPMIKLQEFLCTSLRELGFANPEEEAEITLSYVHGFAFSSLNNKLKDPAASLQALKLKYA